VSADRDAAVSVARGLVVIVAAVRAANPAVSTISQPRLIRSALDLIAANQVPIPIAWSGGQLDTYLQAWRDFASAELAPPSCSAPSSPPPAAVPPPPPPPARGVAGAPPAPAGVCPPPPPSASPRGSRRSSAALVGAAVPAPVAVSPPPPASSAPAGPAAERVRPAAVDDSPWTVYTRRRRRRDGRTPANAVATAAPPPPADILLPAASSALFPPLPPHATTAVSTAACVAAAGSPSTARGPAATPAAAAAPPRHAATGVSAAVVAARAASAAAALTRPTRPERRRATPPPLVTLYVSGVSRAERTRRLRPLVADAAAVRPAAVVDVDRFGATAAVTILASAADAFRAGLASHPPPMREVPTAFPWCPSFLGGRRRRQLAGPHEAAVTAAELCRTRIHDKLDQIAAREAMPPPHRTALRWHHEALLADCEAALRALWAAIDALSPVPAWVARRRSAAFPLPAAGGPAAPGKPRPAQRSPPAAAGTRAPRAWDLLPPVAAPSPAVGLAADEWPTLAPAAHPQPLSAAAAPAPPPRRGTAPPFAGAGGAGAAEFVNLPTAGGAGPDRRRRRGRRTRR